MSIFTPFATVLRSTMSPACASNMVALNCHSNFKECVQVEDATAARNKMWLPSLLCRSECERHYEMWETCLAEIEADPTVKRAFDDQIEVYWRNAQPGLVLLLGEGLKTTKAFMSELETTTAFISHALITIFNFYSVRAQSCKFTYSSFSIGKMRFNRRGQ
jgi:hypothetical protein